MLIKFFSRFGFLFLYFLYNKDIYHKLIRMQCYAEVYDLTNDSLYSHGRELGRA